MYMPLYIYTVYNEIYIYIYRVYPSLPPPPKKKKTNTCVFFNRKKKKTTRRCVPSKKKSHATTTVWGWKIWWRAIFGFRQSSGFRVGRWGFPGWWASKVRAKGTWHWLQKGLWESTDGKVLGKYMPFIINQWREDERSTKYYLIFVR